MSNAAVVKIPVQTEEIRAMFEGAQEGDEDAARELFQLLDGTPTETLCSVLGMGDTARHVQIAFINRAAGRNLLVKEMTQRKLEAMRRELAGTDCTPLERLLVERIALCWLQLHYYETILAQSLGDLSIAQSESQQKRIDKAHKRYLASIKTLAQVRRLQLPSVQVNIGEKQVNVANLNT